ncbi:Uncharacterized protein TCM_024653 [Theobroma cacao]|uniref:Uncharacterized protein n=1 Tax=Theobroma cacao TaxID=3641 RepID=A0A061EWS5_THECC|nr:Uncharacterized protein TCM_024653 [Theobroma cacao]
MEVFDTFGRSLGEKVNHSKIVFYYARNVGNNLLRHLEQRLGFSLTHDLGTYLDIPINHGWRCLKHYQYMVERVQKKLTGWKTNTLFFVGRLTLVQSILLSMSCYVMKALVILQAIYEKIGKKNCMMFFWGSMGLIGKFILLNAHRYIGQKSLVA